MIILRPRQSRAVRHPADVARLRLILNARGYDASPEAIATAWHDWSEANWAVGWASLGLAREVDEETDGEELEGDEAVYRALMSELIEDSTT